MMSRIIYLITMKNCLCETEIGLDLAMRGLRNFLRTPQASGTLLEFNINKLRISFYYEMSM